MSEIIVWMIELEDPANALSALEADLSSEELQRANRFAFPEHRRRFVVAHSAIRRILAMCLECASHDVKLEIGPAGKPRPAFGGLEFNLSHSADRALLAVASSPVGVDLEEVRPRPGAVDIAALAFSPLEQQALAGLKGDRWIAAFFKCWTSKEAYLKALGLGLGLPLTSFDVCVKPDRPARLLKPAPAFVDSNWRLVDLPTGRRFRAVLATCEPDVDVHLRAWRFEEPKL